MNRIALPWMLLLGAVVTLACGDNGSGTDAGSGSGGMAPEQQPDEDVTPYDSATGGASGHDAEPDDPLGGQGGSTTDVHEGSGGDGGAAPGSGGDDAGTGGDDPGAGGSDPGTGGTMMGGAPGSGGSLGSLPSTCAGRTTCQYEWVSACEGEAPAPCQCDAGCIGRDDCCADVEEACADARLDETGLITALSDGDGEAARSIIERGRFDPVPVISKLMYDLTFGFDELEMYVEAGGPVDTQNTNGYSMLHMSQSSLADVELLLAHGADIELRDSSCLTPLMRRIRDSAPYALTTYLIDQGAAVNAVTPMGNTPLLYAISAFQGGPVKYLLDHGADPQVRNLEGQTALTVAVRHEEERVVPLLIEYGADINSLGPVGEPLWVYVLVDYCPYPSQLNRAADKIAEWVFTHPDVVIDLNAVDATQSVEDCRDRMSIAHYVSYLEKRAASDPSLNDGELLVSLDGSEYRIDGNEIHKNGYNLTPLGFVLEGRPRFDMGDRYYWAVETAELSPGTGNSNGANYAERFIAFEPATDTWYYDTRYLNLHGLDGYEVSLQGTLPYFVLDGPLYTTYYTPSLTAYGRPYRP